jgi:hypothetical protein
VNNGVEPITGRLTRADGTAAEFTGWLELTAVLEDARIARPLGGAAELEG